MIELSEPQQQALAEHPEVPLEICDPNSSQKFVLIAADQFQQMLRICAPGPLTDDERRAILRGVWQRAAWDDPSMDAYDHIDLGFFQSHCCNKSLRH